jgi:hypothetical protein
MVQQRGEATVCNKGKWASPELLFDGELSDLVQQGNGKFSATGGDPGEGKKQQSTT